MPDCGFRRKTAIFIALKSAVASIVPRLIAVIASGIALMPTIRHLRPTASSASMAPIAMMVVRPMMPSMRGVELSRPAVARRCRFALIVTANCCD